MKTYMGFCARLQQEPLKHMSERKPHETKSFVEERNISSASFP